MTKGRSIDNLSCHEQDKWGECCCRMKRQSPPEFGIRVRLESRFKSLPRDISEWGDMELKQFTRISPGAAERAQGMCSEAR